ncbi:MAG TPA: hypothetical protein VJN63_12795 [Thermoplasmata archaeon]|nr:hypothetical protein [Thermoplasmata archaeon]
MKPEIVDSTRGFGALRSPWALRTILVSLGTFAGTALAQSGRWGGWDTAAILFVPPLFAGLSDLALWIRSPIWKRREALLMPVFAFGGVLLSFFQTPGYYVIPPLTVGLLAGLIWAFRRWEKTFLREGPRPFRSLGFKLVAMSLLVFTAGAASVAISFGLFTGLFVQGPLDVSYIVAGSLSLVVAIILVLISLGMFIFGFSRLWKERKQHGTTVARVISVARLLLIAGYTLLFVLSLVGLTAILYSRNRLVGPLLYDLTFPIFLVSAIPFLLAAVIPAVVLCSKNARVRAWLGAAVGVAGITLALVSVSYDSSPISPPWGPASVWVSSWSVAAASALLLASSYRSITVTLTLASSASP